MQAVIFKNKEIILQELPKPLPGPGEALIKLSMAGICNTDIELLEGYLDFQGVPGHEFVGLVEECPSAPELVGQRVVGDINCGCGACYFCTEGNQRHCRERTTLGISGRSGAFAEYLCLPAKNLYKISEHVPDQAAVFAEPLAAAIEPGQQTHMQNGQRMLVLGDGKLGLLCAMGLRAYNYGLVLMGHHKHKLAIAKKAGLITRQGPVLAPEDAFRLDYGFYDLVVEATGRPDGLAWALKFVRPEGVVVLKTTTREPSCLDMAKVVVDEITLIGSRCGDIGMAVKFLEEDYLDVLPLVEAVHPFANFKEAFAQAAKPGALKILLKF